MIFACANVLSPRFFKESGSRPFAKRKIQKKDKTTARRERQPALSKTEALSGIARGKEMNGGRAWVENELASALKEAIKTGPDVWLHHVRRDRERHREQATHKMVHLQVRSSLFQGPAKGRRLFY